MVRTWVKFGKKMVPRNQGVRKGHFWPFFWSYQQVSRGVSGLRLFFGTFFDRGGRTDKMSAADGGCQADKKTTKGRQKDNKKTTKRQLKDD